MDPSNNPAQKRILVVIGTRPEGIKLAPVVKALRGRGHEVDTAVALTGQHSELMDQVLEVFGLEPQWDLQIMREGQDLYDVTTRCLNGLREVVHAYRPDVLVVQGDTASVFLGGLVAFYERTRLAHVEAGLRSGDKWRPYPEEVFRRLTTVLADFHFAPTRGAVENLRAEGIEGREIHLTGNTVVDALQEIAARPHALENAALRRWPEVGERLVLVTAHRRESWGKPLRDAFAALRELANRYGDVCILYPVHPNPIVREAADAVLSGHPRILLTEPLSYLDLVQALKASRLVVTDSGGIQEEAPSFGVPVLVMREVTERPEGVDAGVAKLVGTDHDRILAAAAAVLDEHDEAGGIPNPYGDGRAGERIADILIHRLTGKPRRTEDWSGA